MDNDDNYKMQNLSSVKLKNSVLPSPGLLLVPIFTKWNGYVQGTSTENVLIQDLGVTTL